MRVALTLTMAIATLVSIGEAITTMITISQRIVITTIRPIATTTLASDHSNVISDYVFQGIHTVEY